MKCWLPRACRSCLKIIGTHLAWKYPTSSVGLWVPLGVCFFHSPRGLYKILWVSFINLPVTCFLKSARSWWWGWTLLDLNGWPQKATGQVNWVLTPVTAVFSWEGLLLRTGGLHNVLQWGEVKADRRRNFCWPLKACCWAMLAWWISIGLCWMWEPEHWA